MINDSSGGQDFQTKKKLFLKVLKRFCSSKKKYRKQFQNPIVKGKHLKLKTVLRHTVNA
jgi:hypothetical protein